MAAGLEAEPGPEVVEVLLEPARFSPIVTPGSRPRPLVRSRMPIPAVWKSVVASTRSERIHTSRLAS